MFTFVRSPWHWSRHARACRQPDHSWILKLNREWSMADAATLVNGDDDLWLLGIGFVF